MRKSLFQNAYPQSPVEVHRTTREWLAFVSRERAYNDLYEKVLFRLYPNVEFVGQIQHNAKQWGEAHAAISAIHHNSVEKISWTFKHSPLDLSPFNTNPNTDYIDWSGQDIELYKNTEDICYLNAASSFLFSIPSLADSFYSLGGTLTSGTRITKPFTDVMAQRDYFEVSPDVDSLKLLSGERCRDDPWYQAIRHSMHTLNVRRDDNGETLHMGESRVLVAVALQLFLPKLFTKDIGVITQFCAVISKQDRLEEHSRTSENNSRLKVLVSKARQFPILVPDIISERMDRQWEDIGGSKMLQLSWVLQQAYAQINHIHIREPPQVTRTTRIARDAPYARASKATSVFSFVKDSWTHAGDFIIIGVPRVLKHGYSPGEGVRTFELNTQLVTLDLNIDTRPFYTKPCDPATPPSDEDAYMLRSLIIRELNSHVPHIYTLLRDVRAVLARGKPTIM